MDDVISRQAAIKALMKRDKELRNINWYDKPFAEDECRGIDYALEIVNALPSVQPAYTDDQIQKMQDMHQAEVEKAFELGREDAKSEIIRCRDCRWQKDQSGSTAWLPCRALVTPDEFYCGRAERRADGN